MHLPLSHSWHSMDHVLVHQSDFEVPNHANEARFNYKSPFYTHGFVAPGILLPLGESESK